MSETWRDRLRAAIARSGRKHSAIARDAGVAPETLSRILNAAHQQPSVETVARIAHAVNENLGWLFSEPSFVLSGEERRELQKVVRFLQDVVVHAVANPREHVAPNAVPSDKTDIPREFASRGARVVYEAMGDSMTGARIFDRDQIYVKPTRSTRESAGRVVVCRVGADEYVRVLDLRGGRTVLVSRNDRYAAIEVADEDFELIGVVIGRSGAVEA